VAVNSSPVPFNEASKLTKRIFRKKGLQYKRRCVLSSSKELQVWYLDAKEKGETKMIDKIDSVA
jgi:hypothetical protein